MSEKNKASQPEAQKPEDQASSQSEAQTPEGQPAPEVEAQPAAEKTKTNKATMNDKDMEKITLTTAEQLKRQKKVRVKLHMDPGKRKELEAATAAGKKVVWPYETVQINGYTYQIQYGMEVEVPESVAEILKQADLI